MTKEKTEARKAFEKYKQKKCFKNKNSRPIDVHRESTHPEMEAVVEQVLHTIGIRKPPQKTYQEAQKRNLQVLLLDLYVACLHGGHMWLGYPRNSSNQYTDRFKALDLSGKTIMDLVDAMARQAYVRTVIGYHDLKTKTGKQSRVQASSRLFEILLDHNFNPDMVGNRKKPEIVLREKKGNGKKKDILVPDNDHTRQIRADIRRVNNILTQADIQLVGCNGINPDFKLSLLGTQYHRVFNSDFEHGGRWYGHGCLAIRRHQRRFIQINGEPTVELDFKSLHPRMTYDLESIPTPEDGLYSYPGCKPGKPARKVRKILFNTLLNANTERKGIGGAFSSLNEDHGIEVTRDEIEAIAAQLKAYHAPIKHHFGSGIGLHFQFLDSEIAQAILLDLADAGIACLPVHDSFIVARQHEASLLELMMYHYRAKMGSTPVITRKR